ncbi:PREDICTED: uncharacterized protein LOC104750360 [Camelina sativa]|uniref:Uncharacterized protein LOC104750360 n=1 Tax=Camelina sativa TaxID=90675 RepID=A0ABM0WFQ3_CAMSA|nr:PREDICTED: uncharacterized protein LOC104750360 [Camelina sativa]
MSNSEESSVTKSAAAAMSQSVSVVVSPYTLASSDNPGSMISAVEWATEMLNALQAKRKTRFINGTIPKPVSSDPDFENWQTVNSMIVGWIQTSIEPKVKSTVTFISDAHQLWVDLKERFSVGNKVRIHQIKAQLASCRQDGQTVLDYYGRLCTLWEEYGIYKLIKACTCGLCVRGVEPAKKREEEKVHQFVLGLDESRFGGICTNIISMDPLPSLGEVYSRIIREERRLSTVRTSCSHCGRVGHEKKDCWQIVGFPEWWSERNNNGRGSRGRGRGDRDTGASHHMTGNMSLLLDIVPIPSCSVRFADGSKTNATSMGVLPLLDTVKLTNVLYVPDLTCTLLSDRFSRTRIGTGEERDGVYYLTDVATAKIHTVKVSSDQALWHKRLGHPSYSVFSFLPMFLIHLRVLVLTLVMFVFGQNKQEKLFQKFGKSVKMIRSDNSTEFMCLSAYFREQGIIHQTSCVGTPQQNGHVERKHRHILNVSRALLFQAHLPIKFWGEAVLTSAYLINRTPSSVLGGRTPYEVLHGCKPVYDQLRVFGSACYTHRMSRDKDKFGERSRRCMFVGYPFGKKGWKVYDLERNEFIISRDMVFNEDVFPYDQASSSSPVVVSPATSHDDDWALSSSPLVRGSSDVNNVDSFVHAAQDSADQDSVVASPPALSPVTTLVPTTVVPTLVPPANHDGLVDSSSPHT